MNIYNINSAADRGKMNELIDNLILTGPKHWKEIVVAVQAEWTITNWHDVRAAIQNLLDGMLISRTADLRFEIYVSLD